VAQLGIVSSVFGRLDFRLILLDVVVDRFHNSTFAFASLNRLASFVVLLS
jgi:hypothetical protein